MTVEQIKHVLNKIFNSPIIKNKYPMVDKVEVEDVIERIAKSKGNYVVYVNVYLDKIPVSSALLKDSLCGTFKELTSTLGIGGDRNIFMIEF